MYDHKLLAIGIGISMIILGGGLGWGIRVFAEPCNIELFTLSGVLTATAPEASSYDESGDEVASSAYTTSQGASLVFERLEKSPLIEGAIIVIDSPGGSAVAGEELANAFKGYDRPIVAVIQSSGVSAAYWAALGTDRIFASANSQVGSIGAIFSYTDSSKQNEKDGITYNVVSSGKFKDLGSENRPLTDEERALLERDVEIIEQNFIDAIVSFRSLSPEAVQEMADGSFMLGAMAKEKGLIDEIGGLEEARQYLEKTIGRAKICESV